MRDTRRVLLKRILMIGLALSTLSVGCGGSGTEPAQPTPPSPPDNPAPPTGPAPLTWKQRAPAALAHLHSVTYGTKFVAVGCCNANQANVQTSLDGIT